MRRMRSHRDVKMNITFRANYDVLTKVFFSFYLYESKKRVNVRTRERMKQRYGNPEKKKLRRNAFTNRPQRGGVYFLLNNACCFVRVFGNPGALSAACACSLAVSLSATRRLQFASL